MYRSLRSILRCTCRYYCLLSVYMFYIILCIPCRDLFFQFFPFLAQRGNAFLQLVGFPQQPPFFVVVGVDRVVRRGRRINLKNVLRRRRPCCRGSCRGRRGGRSGRSVLNIAFGFACVWCVFGCLLLFLLFLLRLLRLLLLLVVDEILRGEQAYLFFGCQVGVDVGDGDLFPQSQVSHGDKHLCSSREQKDVKRDMSTLHC